MRKKYTNIFDYHRIIVIGNSCSGKSTFSKKIFPLLNLPLYHLDCLYWKPNWIPSSNLEFDKKLKVILKKDKWIIDGNYNRTLSLRSKYADLIIYFDLPLQVSLDSYKERLLDKQRTDITTGCEEKFDPDFIKYMKNFNFNYKSLIEDIILKSNKDYIVFESREEAEDFLKEISQLKI